MSALKIWRPFVPPIRWVGGKKRLMAMIKNHFPTQPFDRFYEPFMGGGAIFFNHGYQASECYVSDLCMPLMNMYEQLQENFHEVWQHIEEMKVDFDYNALREEFNLNKSGTAGFGDRILGAAQFIALNHTNYNGLYRENKKGGYNVPQGKKGKKDLGNKLDLSNISREQYWTAAARLDGCHIMTRDFLKWPQDWPRPGLGSLVFFDPPYLGEFSDYNADKFGEQQHRELRAQAEEFSKRGAYVIVCNSFNELTVSIFGTPTKVCGVERTVGNSLRGPATEAIYVYPPTKSA